MPTQACFGTRRQVWLLGFAALLGCCCFQVVLSVSYLNPSSGLPGFIVPPASSLSLKTRGRGRHGDGIASSRLASLPDLWPRKSDLLGMDGDSGREIEEPLLSPTEYMEGSDWELSQPDILMKEKMDRMASNPDPRVVRDLIKPFEQIITHPDGKVVLTARGMAGSWDLYKSTETGRDVVRLILFEPRKAHRQLVYDGVMMTVESPRIAAESAVSDFKGAVIRGIVTEVVYDAEDGVKESRKLGSFEMARKRNLKENVGELFLEIDPFEEEKQAASSGWGPKPNDHFYAKQTRRIIEQQIREDPKSWVISDEEVKVAERMQIEAGALAPDISRQAEKEVLAFKEAERARLAKVLNDFEKETEWWREQDITMGEGKNSGLFKAWDAPQEGLETDGAGKGKGKEENSSVKKESSSASSLRDTAEMLGVKDKSLPGLTQTEFRKRERAATDMKAKLRTHDKEIEILSSKVALHPETPESNEKEKEEGEEETDVSGSESEKSPSDVSVAEEAKRSDRVPPPMPKGPLTSYYEIPLEERQALEESAEVEREERKEQARRDEENAKRLKDEIYERDWKEGRDVVPSLKKPTEDPNSLFFDQAEDYMNRRGTFRFLRSDGLPFEMEDRGGLSESTSKEEKEASEELQKRREQILRDFGPTPVPKEFSRLPEEFRPSSQPRDLFSDLRDSVRKMRDEESAMQAEVAESGIGESAERHGEGGAGFSSLSTESQTELRSLRAGGDEGKGPEQREGGGGETEHERALGTVLERLEEVEQMGEDEEEARQKAIVEALQLLDEAGEVSQKAEAQAREREKMKAQREKGIASVVQMIEGIQDTAKRYNMTIMPAKRNATDSSMYQAAKSMRPIPQFDEEGNPLSDQQRLDIAKVQIAQLACSFFQDVPLFPNLTSVDQEAQERYFKAKLDRIARARARGEEVPEGIEDFIAEGGEHASQPMPSFEEFARMYEASLEEEKTGIAREVISPTKRPSPPPDFLDGAHLLNVRMDEEGDEERKQMDLPTWNEFLDDPDWRGFPRWDSPTRHASSSSSLPDADMRGMPTKGPALSNEELLDLVRQPDLPSSQLAGSDALRRVKFSQSGEGKRRNRRNGESGEVSDEGEEGEEDSSPISDEVNWMGSLVDSLKQADVGSMVRDVARFTKKKFPQMEIPDDWIEKMEAEMEQLKAIDREALEAPDFMKKMEDANADHNKRTTEMIRERSQQLLRQRKEVSEKEEKQAAAARAERDRRLRLEVAKANVEKDVREEAIRVQLEEREAERLARLRGGEMQLDFSFEEINGSPPPRALASASDPGGRVIEEIDRGPIRRLGDLGPSAKEGAKHREKKRESEIGHDTLSSLLDPQMNSALAKVRRNKSFFDQKGNLKSPDKFSPYEMVKFRESLDAAVAQSYVVDDPPVRDVPGSRGKNAASEFKTLYDVTESELDACAGMTVDELSAFLTSREILADDGMPQRPGYKLRDSFEGQY